MEDQTTRRPIDEEDEREPETGYEDYPDDEEVSGNEDRVPPAPDEEPMMEEEELPPEGVRVDEDGDVSFGDEFFGDIGKEPEEPSWYTPDELRTTPFEQWDMSRLRGDIQDFAPIVRDQLQQRTRQQAVRNTPMPEFMPEPKEYTPKELAEEAKQLACEKLGLEDPEDFDDYEDEHRAAQMMAMQELLQKRNADMAGYRRGKAEWGELQRFNSELAARPDFNEFNEWYISKLRERGISPQQVNEGLYRYARENGNNFGAIPRIIGNWYREFQQERGGGSRYRASQGTRSRMRPPASLESTRGSGYEGRRRVDMRRFGDMDDDAQAQALMNLGIV